MALSPAKPSTIIKLKDPPKMRIPHMILYHYDSGNNYVFMLQQGSMILYNLDKQIVEKEYQYPFRACVIHSLDPYGCVDPAKGINSISLSI